MTAGSAARARWGVLILVLAIAAEARFLGLNTHSLWFDEAFSVGRAQTSLAAMVRYVVDADTHPPLYYATLHAWIQMFGSGETAVRGLSAVVGFLTVPLLYAFAQTMVEADVALAAAALLAASGFAVVAAQEARMYPLLGLLALASWYLLRRAAHERARGLWAGYALSVVLMLYTHYFGFFVLGSQVVYLIPICRRDRAARVPAAVALGAVLLCILPWVPDIAAQAASGRGNPTFRPPVNLRAVLDLSALFGFGGELLGTGGYFHSGKPPLWAEGLLVLPFLGLAGIGLVSLRGERAWCLLCYWAGPIVAALAVSIRFNLFYPRYFSFLAPAFALMVACGVATAVQAASRVFGWREGLRRPAAVVVIAALVLANAPVVTGYRWHNEGNYNWRGAAALITKAAGPQDFLLFIPGFARVPFEYYYRGRQARQELTPVEEYGMLRMAAPDDRVDKAWAHRLAARHPRLWIVATVPVTQSASRRLEGLLADSFSPAQVWDFNHVFVFSLVSRQYHEVSRSP